VLGGGLMGRPVAVERGAALARGAGAAAVDTGGTGDAGGLPLPFTVPLIAPIACGTIFIKKAPSKLLKADAKIWNVCPSVGDVLET
jgi:hypothetical protein